MNENVNVCITPKGDKPVLHFSQFDNERVFTVTVLADDGESAAVLTGLDIEFRLRKTDSHVVTIAPESVADNVITFKTTEQLCACCGQNIASVVLMKDDMVISTLDILVDIQRDILSGGLTSESDIRNLTTQIEQIVPEVLGDDYYTKTEVDELIDDIPTFDPSNYYDKNYINTMYWTSQQIDQLFYRKTYIDTHYYTNDVVYTKSETDNLLADKADKSDVYTKAQTDSLLFFKADKIDEKTAAGLPTGIASFTDAGKDCPLSVLTVDVTAEQSGSGTPSPDNVRPISGFSALNVTRTGKNFAQTSLTGINIDSSGILVPYATFDMIIAPVKAGQTYTATNNESNQFICGFFASLPSQGSQSYNNSRVIQTSKTITAPIDGYIAFRVPTGFTGYQLELGSTATTYEPYNGQTATVNFGQTVYGGVADVTNGKLWVTHNVLSIDNNSALYSSGNSAYLNITDAKIVNEYASAISDKYEYNTWSGATNGDNNYFTLYQNTAWSNARLAFNRNGLSLADFITSLTNNPIQVVYELATPIEITLTPAEVDTILGDNNVYADTGDILTLKYFGFNAEDLFRYIRLIKG